MKGKKTPRHKNGIKAAAKLTARASLTHDDTDAIIRLIDHAKKQGIAFLEAPGGVKFGFRRAPSVPDGGLPLGKSADDGGWIP